MKEVAVLGDMYLGGRAADSIPAFADAAARGYDATIQG
jgi:hypothetical protein